MSPVDAEVGKDEEQRELEVVVPEARALLGGVVELAIAVDLSKEDRSSNEGHDGECFVGRDHLEADLVLDETGVVESALVKDELVR